MKNVLITGVSSGIGFACALRFLREGHRVFGSVRKPDDALELQDKFSDNFIPLLFDVTDQQAIDAAARQVRESLGDEGIHYLINNAGVSVNGPMLHVPIEELQFQFDVNVMGLMRVTQAFAELLKKAAGRSDDTVKIINISSAAGKFTRPFMGPYAASKHAVEAISDALRRELMRYGIDVVVIEPGPIKTDIWAKARNEEVKYQDTDYAKLFRPEAKEQGIKAMEGIAIPVERVSDLVYEASMSSKAKTRYLITPKKLMFKLAMYIFPDRKLDRLFQKQFDKIEN